MNEIDIYMSICIKITFCPFSKQVLISGVTFALPNKTLWIYANKGTFRFADLKLYIYETKLVLVLFMYF